MKSINPQIPSVTPKDEIRTSFLSLKPTEPIDLLYFCHLRWDFVYQRPQHLMARCARVTGASSSGKNRCRLLPARKNWCSAGAATISPLPRLMYPLLRVMEANLFRCADLVFTGGQSLYEAKRRQHHNVHAFPSSIDAKHFGKARDFIPEPEDHAAIPRPRMGFYGVFDERFDRELLRAIAAARPDWHFIMIGPVVKIDPAELPQAADIHYLGPKSYDQLPDYLAGWDAALILFARNESIRFISPTKTPEYLAAGKPVVSTSIKDIVHPYGEMDLVRIADSPEEFIAACSESLKLMPQG